LASNAAPGVSETSALIARVFTDEGIGVHTGATIERVDHDGQFRLRLADRELRADQLLVAAGRHNNLDNLGLETIGLDPSAKSLETDERLRAGERLWAVGDVTAKGAFTHVSR